MKPILRTLRTGLYFQGGASWTCDELDALVYPDVESALEAAHTSGMSHLELNVLLFDDPRYTVRLRLDKLFPARAQSAALVAESAGRRAGDSMAQLSSDFRDWRFGGQWPHATSS